MSVLFLFRKCDFLGSFSRKMSKNFLKIPLTNEHLFTTYECTLPCFSTLSIYFLFSYEGWSLPDTYPNFHRSNKYIRKPNSEKQNFTLRNKKKLKETFEQ